MFEVKQLSVGGYDANFAYLILNNGEAALLDPCGSVDVIFDALKAAGVSKLRYILITHDHRDHLSALNDVLARYPAEVVAHPICFVRKSIVPEDHAHLPLGDGFIEVIYAPGHTQDSILYRLSDDSGLFTGDTLFVGCCGYCQAEPMFKTMREIIFPMADSLNVYSGHHYGDLPFRALGVEKKENPYLNTDDFPLFCERLKAL